MGAAGQGDGEEGCALRPDGLSCAIEHLAFGIDGSPQIHLLATNGDERLIEVVPGRMRLGAHRP